VENSEFGQTLAAHRAKNFSHYDYPFSTRLPDAANNKKSNAKLVSNKIFNNSQGIRYSRYEIRNRRGTIASHFREQVFPVRTVVGTLRTGSKIGKNTLRSDKTSCHRVAANQARWLVGVLAYNLLDTLRQFCLVGEEIKRSMQRLIKRLIKVGAKVAYHGRRWQVHVASAFPLSQHYQCVFG